MKKIVLIAFILFSCFRSFATCTSGNIEVIVKIIPDNFPLEIHWNVADANSNIVASGNDVGDTICLSSSSCYLFTITDDYGDGIFLPGGFWIYVDGALVDSGGRYTHQDQYTFNCPAGSFCTSAQTITAGSYITYKADEWYEFTCPLSGNYTLSTCGTNTCDTKLFIYSSCPTIPYPPDVQGTMSFNDSSCGSQASITAGLISGTTYYIRVGENNGSCSGIINFNLAYSGPITGCTDPLSCNYNVNATQDDGSCIYPPNPLCAGPDLRFDSAGFVNSLSLTTVTPGQCDVDEGCVLGYGTRYCLSFTSHIDNIGTLDYYIGTPSSQPGMFNTNNCHGHAHYEGYGDYRLFDSADNLVPAGHKNGFCVMDVGGSAPKFNCSNMGISAGCYDAYGAGTQCQWIDITDAPTGDYRVAIIINSKHLPDANGHQETNYVNNATQACIHIVHNTTGAPQFTLLPNCTPYVDCSGVPGGNGEMDCNSVCNGPAVYGDIYNDAVLDSQDTYTYLDVIEAQMPATNCNDLSRDGHLSVYDASLVNWCRRGNPAHPGGSAHNHCNFPRNVYNPGDLVSLQISNVDFTNHYVDVEITHQLANVKSYQFTMSGITISSVVSLANPINFPVDVRYIAATNEVFGISIEDSSLIRSVSPHPLVRIYFSAVTDSQICISAITDVVNQDAERTNATVAGSCFSSEITTSVNEVLKNSNLVVIPNPANDRAFIHFNNDVADISDVTITDIQGKVYSVPGQIVRQSWYEIIISNLPSGVYLVNVKNNSSVAVTRFMKL